MSNFVVCSQDNIYHSFALPSKCDTVFALCTLSECDSFINNYNIKKPCVINDITYVNVRILQMMGGYRWYLDAVDSCQAPVYMMESKNFYVWEVDCLLDLLTTLLSIEGTLYITTSYRTLIEMYYGRLISPTDLDQPLQLLRNRNVIIVGD